MEIRSVVKLKGSGGRVLDANACLVTSKPLLRSPELFTVLSLAFYNAPSVRSADSVNPQPDAL